MSKGIAAQQQKVPTVSADAAASVILQGDISKLTPQQKVSWYNKVCHDLGLNPTTQPLGYYDLKGKQVLYAKKDAAEQLRKIHGVSIYKLEREVQEGMYVVTAYARDKNGKEDSDMGAVPITNLKGEALANAMLKSVTKAKRRVTLSICGLGMLDETEVESIDGAEKVEPDKAHQEKPAKQIPNLAPTTVKDQLQQLRVDQAAVVADPGEYVVPFGPFRGHKINAVDAQELASYAAHVESEAERNKKPIKGVVEEFLHHANLYLASLIPNDPLFPEDDNA